jgi:hypothetical protein
MTGIPITNFDYFNLAEIPTFILCNPNKEKIYSLGGISERKYSPRYNALSELSFRADKYINGVPMEYYDYITNRRLVYLEDIGYFMITEATESNDGIVKYKEVVCQSLEVELSSRKLTGFVSGSGIWDENGELISSSPIPETLEQLYIEILPYLGRWRFDIIPDTLGAKFRSFDVSDTTLYNLLMVDIEQAYECVFDFDTVNDLIFIRDIGEDIPLTDIFVSHDNVIKSMTVEEVTDELATCLYVVGGGNLGLNYVNPLGNNYIYNFGYFKTTKWMGEDLIDAITAWENKFETARPLYTNSVLSWLEDGDIYLQYSLELNITSNSALYSQRQYDIYIESGSSIDDSAMIELHNEIMALYTAASAIQTQMQITQGNIDEHFGHIEYIADSLKLDNIANFSSGQQNQLQAFIIQSSYVDENIIKTDLMTSASIMMQQTSLYNQGVSILDRVSSPRYSFEIDSVSFLQIKSFEDLGVQLALGKQITLEIEDGRYLLPSLLGVDIDFDNPINFKLIFGNRLRLNDPTFRFNDLIGKALNAGTSMNLNSVAFNDWTRDYKSQYQNLASGVVVGGTAPAEKIDVNPGSINLITSNLMWNGIPINTWGIGMGVGATGSSIKITLFSGGESIAMYEPTSEGLNLAISAAGVGDVIFIPDAVLDGNFYIPTGVSLEGLSSRETIIQGKVTIEPSCLLENLKVINQATDDTEVIAVEIRETVPSTDASRIKGCEIFAYQCGSGSSTAIYISDDLGIDIIVENSTIVADSYIGVGYCFSSNGDDCYVFRSSYFARTEVFHDRHLPPPD